ncbi:MAG: hypothetical protein AAF528_07990 [Cyanobacteria bacterium P01_C01_bin.121]
MREPTDARAELYARLEGAKGQWSDQQFKTFAVMCYRTIEPFLSDEAEAAVSWVGSDLLGQEAEASFERVLEALRWNTIDPDAGRADENRFSFEVLKLLEDTPLEAAKAAVAAVSVAADLQVLYARAQVEDSQTQQNEAISEFHKRLALSQIIGLLEKINAGISYENLLP